MVRTPHSTSGQESAVGLFTVHLVWNFVLFTQVDLISVTPMVFGLNHLSKQSYSVYLLASDCLGASNS